MRRGRRVLEERHHMAKELYTVIFGDKPQDQKVKHPASVILLNRVNVVRR